MATNLPQQVTSFIGRQRELAQARELLAHSPLLTLTGPGGCGKTRLALQLAAELQDAFPDGVWLIELAALADGALLAQTVAGALWSALGLRELAGRSLLDQLTTLLQTRQLLLLLDNCEHLVTGCAELVQRLLQHCPELRVLATSREALNIPGEISWSVPPLALPEPEQPPAGGPALVLQAGQSEAVRLFIDRARAVQPGFSLDEQNVLAVVQICRQLDGIPLAIELGAARTRMLSVEQIAARLDDCFRLLSAGSRLALPRQQTLRATIDWSYQLLTEPERRLLRRLAVFAGSFTLEAAEAVCGAVALAGHERPGIAADERDLLALLGRLVDKSLVQVQQRRAHARYSLLETVRHYAHERLAEAGELAALRSQHAAFYLQKAEQAAPWLRSGQRRPWLAALDVDHDNLRAAQHWSHEQADSALALRLAGALWWFWFHRGYWSEGRSWLERALALPVQAWQGDQQPQLQARASALCGLGWIAGIQGDHAAALAWLSASAALWRQVAQPQGLGLTLLFMSTIAISSADLQQGHSCAEEALALFRSRDDQWGEALALTNLGITAIAQSSYAQAQPLLEQGARLFRALGDAWGLALPLRNLAIAAYRQGHLAQAAELHRQALLVLREIDERWFISRSLESLATVLALQGACAPAARLFGASEALRERLGALVLPFYRDDYDRGLAAARAGLDDQTFAAAWSAGLAMSADEAIAYALDDPAAGGPEPAQPQEPAAGMPLTRAAPAAPALRILALGPARVERAGQLVDAATWGYVKPRELLFYLLCYPGRTREQIGLALWPDASPAQLRSSFGVALHRLRRVLGHADWVVVERERYSINHRLGAWYDVAAFEAGLTEARQRYESVPAAAIERYRLALALYGGDFLEDFVAGEWWLPLRETLLRMYLDGLQQLAALLQAAGRHADAAELYRRILARDSLLEQAHRELMRCLARMGERAQALRHYQLFSTQLQHELAVPPDPQTTALYEHLRRGEEL